MRTGSKVFAAIALTCVLAAPLYAQEFPGRRPIEMTVMFGPGSAADVTARRLADGMAKDMNATIPVINRTGAGGALGYGYVSRQQPDGHSIVWNSNSISTTYHMGLLPFDYTAFEPVARASVETPVIVVRADAPWKTLSQLLDHAKKNPDALRVGNSGTGSHTHFAATALFIKGGAKAIDVPFGDGQAVINLLGDRIEAVVQLPAAVVAQVQSGELRVLAALGSKRDPVFPDVPTARELGYDIALDMWRGIAVPKGTPKPVIARLQAAIQRTVESPEFKQAGETLGFTPAYLPADAFAELIASDDRKLAQLMSQLGMKKTGTSGAATE